MGCPNINTIDGVVQITHIYFSHKEEEDGRLRSRHWKTQCLVRNLFLFHRWPSPHYDVT